MCPDTWSPCRRDGHEAELPPNRPVIEMIKRILPPSIAVTLLPKGIFVYRTLQDQGKENAE
jgi:hypothetical protein